MCFEQGCVPVVVCFEDGLRGSYAAPLVTLTELFMRLRSVFHHCNSLAVKHSSHSCTSTAEVCKHVVICIVRAGMSCWRGWNEKTVVMWGILAGFAWPKAVCPGISTPWLLRADIC